MLRVRYLEIIGQNGKAVIVLSTNPFGQPVMTFHDINEQRRFGVRFALTEVRWSQSLTSRWM